MASSMSDTKENADEDMGQDILDASNKEDQHNNVETVENCDAPCNVLVEGDFVRSESGNENPAPETESNDNMPIDKNMEPHSIINQDSLGAVAVENEQVLPKPTDKIPIEVSDLKTDIDGQQDTPASTNQIETADSAKVVNMESLSKSPEKLTTDAKAEADSELTQRTITGDIGTLPKKHDEAEAELVTPRAVSSDIKVEKEKVEDLKSGFDKLNLPMPMVNGNTNSKNSFLWGNTSDGSESGTEAEQSAFMKELENFFKERSMEFKPPKFYGEGLNCLKLWRSVIRLGGYDKVTSCKLWRQVGESFKPPKTCTTVSWTFRGFYEKALLDYERHNANGGELDIPVASPSQPVNVDNNQGSGMGRARRDAATRAMQGWHSRLLGNGEVSDPVIKDKSSVPMQKREKQLKSLGLPKRKKPSYEEQVVKAARSKVSRPQLDTAIVDIGPPADWVKINVQKTKDCFEVYALVPGLLREEVRVQSDPAGRLVISGEPGNANNPWGVTPFKKVVSLPTRIDPHHTSAVVTLHGQLFVRVPFEQ
ncbi:hypothetical protein SLEP1_g39074 [Rubroshorea leprosula]|uniref:Uncharacterized protein n=1 Tax=Rubroshorea leprosula TaxID=152421 RepID=A0AAV5KZP0_9ROSI|nr:hypothetical protein SLEP1_g39074 [Rubroshorea leprosula]